MKVLKNISILLLITLLILNFSWGAQGDKFDSAHSVLLGGEILNGKIMSSSKDPRALGQEIKSQLKFAIGQLNGLQGGAISMARTRIEISKITPLQNGRVQAEYKAWTKISWPLELAFPANYSLLLPKEGNRYFLEGFLKKHGRPPCVGPMAHTVTLWNHWYHYRPANKDCPLLSENKDVFEIGLELSISGESSEGKSPEYKKIWEDGRLVVTAIFSRNNSQTLPDKDQGVLAYREMLTRTLKIYGPPFWSNVPVSGTGFVPGVKDNMLHLKFQHRLGELDMVFMLVNNIEDIASGPSMLKMYNARTKISDFISYSGHSALGININRLSDMGVFSPGQYQIFLMNGCNSFAYIDDSLARSHQAVNPGYGPYKFVDVLTNSMPSFFVMNAYTNAYIIQALIDGTKTYHQILSALDKYQRVVVTGEEDND